MSIVGELYRLETLDSDIEGLEAGVLEARRRVRENPQLARTEARAEELRGNVRTAHAELRSAETDLAELEGKIGRDERRMYSGQIVDARELGSLEREIAGYKTRRGPTEERVLTLMETLEAMQGELVTLDRQVEELRATWETDRPMLAARITEMIEALAAHRAERRDLVAAIDRPALDLYDRVRARSGHAISPLSGDVCGACRVTLPAKDVQHARGGALVTCSNCSRILYAGR